MEAGVFPQGLGGLDNLGALLGTAPGGESFEDPELFGAD